MHYLAFAVFCTLASMLLSKSFDGYMVRQGDTKNWLGMSKEVHDAMVLFEEKPAWTNSMFGGMPAVQISHQKTMLDVTGQVKNAFNALTGSSGIAAFVLAMVGGYILALALGASPWIALLCGAGMGLSTFEVLYFSAGHNAKVYAVAYMPFILAGVVWAYRGRLFFGSALAALATAMHVASGHPQMTYYLLFLLVAIGLAETWRMGIAEKDWSKALRVNALILAAGVIGVLPHYVHLAETKEYAEHTIRGERLISETEEDSDSGLDREYILEYSMSEGEWWSIMCPDIKGGNSPLYWGEQKFSGGAFYFGAILVALFFMFLVAGRDRMRWPLLAVTVLAILLSRREAGVLMDFFLEYMPAFNKFRDTKMILVLVLLTVSMGAALGLKELIAAGQPSVDAKRRWWWMGSALGLVGLFGGFYLAPEVFFDFQSSIRQDVAVEQLGYAEALNRRLEVYNADVLRTLGLLVLLAGVVGALLWGKLKPVSALAILVVVTTVDLWNVDKRYFNEEKVNGVYRNWVKKVDHIYPFTPEPQMMKLLAQDFPKTPENVERSEKLYARYLERFEGIRLTRAEKERLRTVSQFGAMRFASPYRISRWESPFNDSSVSYFFQSIGGYHAAKLRRYQDFIDRVLLPERQKLIANLQSGVTQTAFDGLVGHKMLNTRYILFGQMADPVAVPNVPGFAWIADEWSWAESPDDEIAKTAALTAPTKAVVHSDFRDELSGTSPGATGSIELVSYTPAFLEYEANLSQSGLGVFSEIWYPEGWIAHIDGEPAETFRANYVLRALKIPAGTHTITWEFVYQRPAVLDVLFNVLLLLFVVGAGWWGLRNKESIETR